MQIRFLIRTTGISALFLLILVFSVHTAPFVRIGDIDGFGDSPTASDNAANGADADSDSDGLLEDGEFLIDRNGNGSVATGSGDDFDNRSAGETADTAVTDSVFSDVASSGSKWTDISLSTSFSGPDFPDTGGTGTPNEPIFIFDFTVLKTDIIFGVDVFFNLLFGDYDVSPADIDLLFPGTGAASRSIALTLQAGSEDGLIQAAFATLAFSEVFSDGGTTWDGEVRVEFDAPNEPYTAFDYVELSTEAIPLIPEPSTFLLFFIGLIATIGVGYRRRKHAA